jgi:hypothetical protein
VLALLALPTAALGAPTATVTIDHAIVPAPIYSSCTTTVHPDGTATMGCGDGVPSTAQQLTAPPGAVARIKLSAPVAIGNAHLGEPNTSRIETVIAVQRVDATTYDVVVPVLTRPSMLFFGGSWSDGSSYGDANYAALLAPAPPALVGIERRAARGPRVVVALHAGGRVTAQLRRGGRLLGRGARTLTGNGEAEVLVTLTRAGRRALRRTGRLRASLTIVARQVGVEQVTFSRVVSVR